MKALNIAWYTLLRNLRDLKSMAEVILIAIITVLILGSALGRAYDVQNISRRKAVFINMDKSVLSERFESFINTEEIKDILEINRVESYESGMELLKEGKVSAMIVIEKGTFEKINLGQEAPIKIYHRKTKTFSSMLVDNIVENFISGANITIAKSSIGGNMEGLVRKDLLQRVPLSAKGNIPRALDYYGVTILVLMIMYGSLYSVDGMGDDYLEGMRNRLFSTPVRLSSHFTGKIAGTVFTVYIQALVIIFFTKLVYNVNWGSNMAQVLFIAFTLAVFSVSMGLMTVMVAKDVKIANAALSTIIPVMTFISGGYVWIRIESSLIDLLPSKLVHTAFFNSIYGEFSGQTISSVAILWVMILLMGIVSVIAGRRRLN